MPPNPPSNSRLPRLAVWSGYGTGMVNIQQLLSTTKTIFITFHQEQLQNKGPYFKVLNRSGSVAR